MPRPFAQASENNKRPILDVLQQELSDPTHVLEIGSGTGQHAVFFAEQMPHLQWQTSDLEDNIAGIQQWIEHAGLGNVLMPVVLNVAAAQWPIASAQCVYTANTLHIMSWRHVQALFAKVGAMTLPGAKLIVYGPFNYAGRYTSESNQTFDLMLQARDPLSGLRNVEDLDELAQSVGLQWRQDYAMPANNRVLVWQKV